MAGFLMRTTFWLGAVEGSTTADRAKWLLKTFANLLLETNPGGVVGEGWTLDPRNPTVDDIYMPISNRAFILFLISKSGAKLMLGYSLCAAKFSKPFSASNNLYMDGLFFSMIPAGSSSVFGTTYGQDDFIPLDATWPTAFSLLDDPSSTPSTSTSTSLAQSWTASYTYHAGILTDGDIILFRLWDGSYYGNMIMIGPIIKTLAHPTMDTLPTNKMLVWRLTQDGNTLHCSEAMRGSYWGSSSSSSSPLVSVGSCAYYRSTWKCDLFRADGEHLTNYTTNVFFTGMTALTGTNVANATITGFYRWVALCIGVATDDPTANYIVRGDGFKGYLDTDFIRYTSTGGRLDDGNFYGLGNLAFGWDPSNANW